MKRKHIIALVFLVLAVALIWLLARERPGGRTPSSNVGSSDHGGGKDRSWTARRLSAPRSLKKPDDVSEEDWNTFLRNRAIAEASNQRILFYGKVLDQNADPVAGARIKATAVSRTGAARVLATGEGQSKNQLEATTAQNGRFKMDGGKGFALNFKKIECDGYVLSPQTESQFMYGQLLRDPVSSRFHHPDPAKPVIFRMWKLGKLEPLLCHEGIRIRLDPTEKWRHKPYASLIKQKNHAKPDETFDVRIERDPNGAERVVFKNGGIAIRKDDTFMFEAPLDGYNQTLDLGVRGKSDSYSYPTPAYFQLNNGEVYGVCRLLVLRNHRGATQVSFRDVRINPNGSRNLQYDGTNRIRPGFR